MSLCSASSAGSYLLHWESEKHWHSNPAELLSGSEMPPGEWQTSQHPHTHRHVL